MRQKFHKGDWVQIAKDLGPSMSHFTADCEAIVIGSYKDQFGGPDTTSYTLYVKGEGETSWYHDHQMTLIKRSRLDKLKQWEVEAKAEEKEKSDLDWIFSHGKEVLKNHHYASVQALAECFGLTDLWGNHGEGFIYYQNIMITLQLAKPFLKSGDKAGWLAHCKKLCRKC